ncbi:unnamed protein product [Brachionus calyciflorus]|uniref:Uncharacterized protein n=1 Tax=Brachionus calyciflorus TaxID=104777 RepID=A0A814D8Q6_9BILA|nr:unnamed protein product [Brachionus calyciflorus]
MYQNLNNPDKNRTGINRFKCDVLENNWIEDRFDKDYLKQQKPLNLNVSHAYETTYSELNKNSAQFTPNILQDKAACLPVHRVVAFPGYQPEIAVQPRRETYETESRVNYLDPRLKLFPVNFERLLQN